MVKFIEGFSPLVSLKLLKLGSKIRGRGSTIVLEPWRYVVTFPEEGHPRPHRNTLPTPQAPLPSVTSVPGSMTCFRCMRRFDPLQFSFNFYYSYICLSVLKMYWVVLTVDCRNSVCRNRVCRNSVCLPIVMT